MRKPTFWFPTRSRTNQTVQLLKMDLERDFTIYVAKTKALINFAVTAKLILRLCFRIGKTLVFLTIPYHTPTLTYSTSTLTLPYHILPLSYPTTTIPTLPYFTPTIPHPYHNLPLSYPTPTRPYPYHILPLPYPTLYTWQAFLLIFKEMLYPTGIKFYRTQAYLLQINTCIDTCSNIKYCLIKY